MRRDSLFLQGLFRSGTFSKEVAVTVEPEKLAKVGRWKFLINARGIPVKCTYKCPKTEEKLDCMEKPKEGTRTSKIVSEMLDNRSHDQRETLEKTCRGFAGQVI